MNYCDKCPFKGRPKVPSEGNPKACRYILLGEAPAHEEVRKGRPFVGATGRLLMAFMQRVGISRDECYIMNAVLCQLPYDKKGLAEAIRCCRPRLLAELETINTGATLAVMGKIARDALYPDEKGGILASRGWRTYDGRDAFVMAHPAYYLYNPNDSQMLLKDLQRLRRGRQYLVKPFEIARAVSLQGKYGEGKVTWVSQEDFAWVRMQNPFIDKGYPSIGHNERLHSYLMESIESSSREGWLSQGLRVDHINRERLDNRRSNLRLVTPTQHSWNASPHRDGRSKYKGVHPIVASGIYLYWRVMIKVGEDHKVVGLFKDEEEAARAYDEAAREHFGEYAYLNFPELKLEWTAWVLDTKELLEEFIKELHRKPLEERGYIAFDIETTQIDYQRDRILCLSISPEYGRALIIPDSLLYQDKHEFVTTGWSKQKWAQFESDPRYRDGSYLKPNYDTVALLSELFNITGYTFVGHNVKFDLRFLVGQLGITPPVSMADTIVMHYTLDERRGGHGLKAIADDYLDVGDYEHDLFNYIAKKSGHYSNVPRRVLYRYNATDTECTLRLAHVLEAELKQQGLFERPYKFPMEAALPMLLDAELEGVGVDWEEFQRVDTEELMPELERLRLRLCEISGVSGLNPLSSQKVNNLLYDHFNFPIIKVRTRAAGKRLEARSSQRAVLDGWAKMWKQGTLHVSKEAWEFAETLRQYRHIRKMQGSYARKWPRFKGTDGRVHTSFLLRGTVTGRLSSKDPPLQTIPSKVTDKWGPLIANAHVPRPGWKYLYADYSQAELMAAACMSNDEFMLGTFQKKDVDYHSEVALAAFGENFTRDERQACKRLTFGWLFGGNAYEIALDALQFEGPVAERFAKEWDDLFKGVVTWREQQGELMQRQGYVESVFGRRRRHLLLTSRNLGKAKRVAMNAPIQSAVSDLTLISATRLHEIYKGSDFAKVVLLIHDSLIMEVRDDKVEEVKAVMHEVMIDTPTEVFPQIQFQADVKVGESLGDLT